MGKKVPTSTEKSGKVPKAITLLASPIPAIGKTNKNRFS
jgi:hypothetical protein